MAEDLTDYLAGVGIRVKYLHSDIDTLERAKIIRDMRLDVFDVLVGINLLREGLDIPEISLVAILDADKEGFLRNETSLIQTIGRASRNAEGHVIMYADTITDHAEGHRRDEPETCDPAEVQHGTRNHAADDQEGGPRPHHDFKGNLEGECGIRERSGVDEQRRAEEADRKDGKQMRHAAADLNFEAAAELRDRMVDLKKHYNEITKGL